MAFLLPGGWSCSPSASSGPLNDLDRMETARIRLGGHLFEVWLARTREEVEHGLMQTPESRLAPIPGGPGEPEIHRGMLFVFSDERPLSFWMYNTITPLDIAYLNSEGVIVKTHTMAALETRTYPSVEPARMALEVRAGLFERLGIAEGDRAEIPESVFKTAP